MAHWLEAYDGVTRYLVNLDHLGFVSVGRSQADRVDGPVKYRINATGLIGGKNTQICLLEAETESEIIDAYKYLRDTILDGECESLVASFADFTHNWKFLHNKKDGHELSEA